MLCQICKRKFDHIQPLMVHLKNTHKCSMIFKNASIFKKQILNSNSPIVVRLKSNVTLSSNNTLNETIVDQNVGNLLQEWNLENLVIHFKEQKITLEVLKIIKSHHVALLFKNQALGDMIVFEHKLTQWRRANMYSPYIHSDSEECNE